MTQRGFKTKALQLFKTGGLAMNLAHNEPLHNKYFYLDFEFHSPNNEHPTLVSVAYQANDGKIKSLWLYKTPSSMRAFIDIVLRAHTLGYIFVAYAVTAEARCFLALFKKGRIDMRVCDLKWIDLYLEYRMILNHNKKYRYGKHLKKGRIIELKPKPYGSEGGEQYGRPEYGLLSANYKLLGHHGEQNFKDFTRDIILTKNPKIILENKDRILKYNESDVANLADLRRKIFSIYEEEFSKEDYSNTLKYHMFSRGDYAARSAIMESIGYPINYEATKNFTENVPEMLFDLQEEINLLFPNILPFKLKKDKYTWNQKITREWIQTQKIKNWPRTDKGALSLSLEAFQRAYTKVHEFPKDCLGHQIKRYLSFKRSLNGFLPPKKGASNFWDYVGSDKRVRPYMGIYSSQSSRSQPKATGFIHLKSAWMRSLVHPPKGKAICSIDYGSQEFLLGGLMASSNLSQPPEKDANMVEAYLSGDPYSWFAKAANAMPEEGNKHTHGHIRNAFKSTVLALQYDMGDESLKRKLEHDTGKKWTLAEARLQSSRFRKIFSTYIMYRKRFVISAKHRYQMSDDGWTLFSDNPNPRSQGNWPTQTMGAVIMRKAVSLAQDEGLNIIFTLHDALYMEYHSQDFGAIKTLGDCMQKAFKHYMKTPIDIRLDYDVWSSDYEGQEKELSDLIKERWFINVNVYNKYIDPRAKKEYQQFKKYFTTNT